MATSGYIDISGSNNAGRYLRVSWSLASTSIANNSTTINYIITCLGTSGYVYGRKINIYINGVNVYSQTGDIQLQYGSVLRSNSITIGHNPDGSKAFSISGSAAIYTFAVNCSNSGSWSLPSIPRKAELTSAPNFNDEENPKITYTNKAGSAVTLAACISLTTQTDDIKYRTISNSTSGSYTFNLTEEERNILRNATTTANSRTVYFYVRTTVGGSIFYSRLDRTLTIVNGKPVFKSASAVNNHPLTLDVRGSDNNSIIKGLNCVKVNADIGTKKGASLKSISVVNGKEDVLIQNNRPYELLNIESGNIIITATDSRGNSIRKEFNLKVYDYVIPTVVLEVATPTAAGDTTVTMRGNWFTGTFANNKKNAVRVEFMYKVAGGAYPTTWTNVTPSTPTGTQFNLTRKISGLDYKKEYTFKARIADSIDTTGFFTETREITVKAIPVFDWGKNDFAFHVPVSINGIDYTITEAEFKKLAALIGLKV